MPAMIGLGIGALTGIIKSEAIDAPKAERERTLAAATQRYSPWTGLKASPVQEADPVGSALSFGSQGASLGQNFQGAQDVSSLRNAQADFYKNAGPWGGMPKNQMSDDMLMRSYTDPNFNQSTPPAFSWNPRGGY